VETNHAGEVFPGTRADIHKYLQGQGYVYDSTVGKRYSRDQSRLSQIFARPGLCYDATRYMREIPGTREDIHKYLQGQAYVYDTTVGERDSRDQSKHSQISARPGQNLRFHSRYERDSRDQRRLSQIFARPGLCHDATRYMREIPGTRVDIHTYLQGAMSTWPQLV
jgi:hypothetical protein